jgi:hypothetical protein
MEKFAGSPSADSFKKIEKKLADMNSIADQIKDNL